jgi:hypothetical protein
MTTNQRTKTMTTFHTQQLDCGRGVQKKANAATFKFTPPNLHSHRHEARKIRCNNVQRTVQAHIVNLSFFTSQALPLVKARFLRLANSSPKTARSPARRSRDSRATSGGISAQRPGNGRAVATAMPPDGRADDLQDNLPCSRLGRANVRAGNLRDDSPQISTMTFKNYEHTNHTNARS